MQRARLRQVDPHIGLPAGQREYGAVDDLDAVGRRDGLLQGARQFGVVLLAPCSCAPQPTSISSAMAPMAA